MFNSKQKKSDFADQYGANSRINPGTQAHTHFCHTAICSRLGFFLFSSELFNENAIDAYWVYPDRADTANKVEAFENSGEAQRGKKISDADAAALIASANAILSPL